MKKEIKYIIREVPPEHTHFSYYFDCDGFTAAGGDYCNNLFIISRDRYGQISGFNIEEYQNLQNEIENLLEMYQDIVDKSNYTQYSSIGAMLFDLGLVSSIHNTRRIKEITEWLKACISAEYDPEETTAKYLTFKTGKQWDTDEAYGYCQGDYVKIVYCPEHYKDGVKQYGEIWLGRGKEFQTIELDENGEEIDICVGYIIADCQVRNYEDYKKLVCEWADIPEDETRLEMIDGYKTVTQYTYRAV